MGSASKVHVYIEGIQYRCRLNLRKRRWFTSGAFLHDGRKTVEAVLGKHVDTALGDSGALREEGMEVGLEILRRWEVHKQHRITAANLGTYSPCKP